MKALTNKRFSSLPEVVAKQEREIEEKKRRSNRILRDVFNRVRIFVTLLILYKFINF